MAEHIAVVLNYTYFLLRHLTFVSVKLKGKGNIYFTLYYCAHML